MICDLCWAHLVVDVDMRTGASTLRVIDGPYRCGMAVYVSCPVCRAPSMIDTGGGILCRSRHCNGVWKPNNWRTLR